MYQNRSGSWRAEIFRQGRKIYERTFATIEEARAGRAAYLLALDQEQSTKEPKRAAEQQAGGSMRPQRAKKTPSRYCHDL